MKGWTCSEEEFYSLAFVTYSTSDKETKSEEGEISAKGISEARQTRDWGFRIKERSRNKDQWWQYTSGGWHHSSVLSIRNWFGRTEEYQGRNLHNSTEWEK